MKQVSKYPILGMLTVLTVITFGCSATYQVAYPPASTLFVTMGDDPGTESVNPYLPKGTFVHISEEFYLPIPIFGLIPLGNANPAYVFERKVLPRITEMGGNALTNAHINYTPPPGVVMRFLGLGFFSPSRTIVTGQVVRK